MRLSPHLFHRDNNTNLREIETLPEFNICGHNLNNISHKDDTVYMSDSEKKLQNLLVMMVEKSDKKRLTINCKKLEIIAFSKW